LIPTEFATPAPFDDDASAPLAAPLALPAAATVVLLVKAADAAVLWRLLRTLSALDWAVDAADVIDAGWLALVAGAALIELRDTAAAPIVGSGGLPETSQVPAV